MLWSTYVSNVLGDWLWTGVFNPVSMSPIVPNLISVWGSLFSHWGWCALLRGWYPTICVTINGTVWNCFCVKCQVCMLLFDQKLFPLYVTDLCFVSLNCAGPFWNNDILTLKFSLMMCLVLYLYWCYCPMVHGFLCAGVHRQS